VPEKLRGADFFDAKGLVETLVSPWISSDELLWTPLKALVAKLKATPYAATGKSYWDFTTIVLATTRWTPKSVKPFSISARDPSVA